MGASVGKALRSKGWYVFGMDTDERHSAEALANGALDEIGEGLEAELAVLATPFGEIQSLAEGLLGDERRPENLTVTDVSGVKGPVVAGIKSPRFIGGHPMAGSEQAGASGADAELFVGAIWVLTPTPETDLNSFSALSAVITSLGADVVTLPPEEHDRLVALVSHVPHLVAATLMNAAVDESNENPALLRLAAGGFRDMTRIAGGGPEIWPGLCIANAKEIVSVIDRIVGDLVTIRNQVDAGSGEALLSLLDQASRARRALPTRALRPDLLSELRIVVPDREGVLAEITSLASSLGINIYDIEIAHSSEGDRGVLVLLLDRKDAIDLAEALAGRGYSPHARDLS
ncbi:MAG: prephenate dehydrogenase/arogenate dehydrogenase family protein [Acidimicrobiales bacterium]